MKIGVCTGGGDCPGLNAALRGVVKHAISTYGMEVVGIKDSFDGLMSRPYGVRKIELNEVTHLLSRGGTFLGTTNAGNPFSYQSGDKSKPCDLSEKVVAAYKDLGLDAIIVIGGDGTQTIANQLSALDINLVGIPKTIDNDLEGTDETIGFRTAVDIAADAVARLQTTAESHDRIMVLEVMGRDAGHLALESGIAGGANVILLPEIPFTFDSILRKIEERKKMGRFFSIVVVSEGAYEKGGKTLKYTSTTSANQSSVLGGIGAVVAQKLHDLAGIDARITVLGHVQRGGSPNHYDRILASKFAIHAVDLVHKKKYGYIVGMQKGRITEIPYPQAAGKMRPIPADADLITTAEGLGICLGR